ncbi:uncharacterized protein LOC132039881 [Lycium ferocissimum]|uniref:uncharacterized protein LOC132039881 n=1 Tax=Lycium ferocissimum TaxID=112874 RepID=UPI002814A7E1|nr:uncharacterized protein LOC132039881 [Lycium ferocissimum]
MRQHLINLENAFVYGFSCLNIPDAQWVSNTVNDIKQSLRIDDDEQLQELLMQNSENAFRSLSDILGYNAYFLEDLRKAFDEKNKEAGHDESDLFGHCVGVSSLTILDAKTAAICMLIVRCFDHESQPECYNSKLKITLFRHLTLWSQASRVYTFYIKEKQLTDFTTTFTENPSLLARVVNSGQPQATGNFGFVYRIYLPTDDNEWNLKAGAYALNVSKTSRCNFHLEAESRSLPDVQYAYVIKLLGTGYAELSGETVMVLVTEWVPGGDLESKMNGLKWDQVKHILKVLAYALYTVHRTGNTCLCDLKPANILLDEEQNISTSLQHKGLTKLMGLIYEIHYKKEVENKVADALSRRDDQQQVNNSSQCLVIVKLLPQWIDDVLRSYEGDQDIIQAISRISTRPGDTTETTIQQGLVRYKGKVWIGKHGNLRQQLVNAIHVSGLGDSGVMATYQRLKAVFYWPLMVEDVKKVVQECDTCQRCKDEQDAYPGLLQPLPIPDRAWEHISMDFIESLPKSEG